MSPARPSARSDLGVFLAHALVVESEAAQRLEELADAMTAHNNPDVSELFRKLAGFGRQHADEVRELLADVPPVRIAPWEYDWGGGESPEAAAGEDAHYLMTRAHALQMALRSEQAAHAYYASVARDATHRDVERCAAGFAAEEAQHVAWVKEWIDREGSGPEPLAEDDDPAHMPQ